MKDFTFGFIGTGNMGGALVRAVAGTLEPPRLLLADHIAAKAEQLAAETGGAVASVKGIAEYAHYLFLGVKPQGMGDLLAEIAPLLRARKDRFVLVSMAAGIPIAGIQQMVGAPYPVIRIMPNTPVAVGKGLVLYAKSKELDAEQLQTWLACMTGAGVLDPIEEAWIDAASAVSGCGPAFAALFMEALADGAVACGLPRDRALSYAAYMLLGAAAMVAEGELHPAKLKDGVCSPGGTTIAGVRALEQGAFRAAVMNAVIAAYQKTKELAK
ncbi:MAG: pyrroline-5-carboxylate reductase [Eubacteriales bacterium]